MPEHSPGCPFGSDEPPPPSGSFEAAVQVAVYAFLAELGVPDGSMITIRAGLHAVDAEHPDEIINLIEIGVGRLAQDKMAAEYARETLSTGGAPWMN